MGTDVHIVFQKKTPDGWQDVPANFERNRHYFLFSWIAGVRNGSGFAGVPTYQPIKPIAERRGLPDDFPMHDEDHPTTLDAMLPCDLEYMDEADKLNPTVWMGDHSHSWLSFDEILSTPAPDRVWQSGVVPRAIFDSWDGHSAPADWSGDVSGNRVVRAATPVDVTDETTHVRIFWIREGGGLTYFTDEIRRLKELHGEGRIVFGFDS